MLEVKQVYKCMVCGNIVEGIHSGQGQLICCGKPMTLQVENTVDAAREKHVPIIERVDGGFLVKVGSVEHPMLDNHYIEWIELHVDNKLYRKYLNPGDKPEALFNVDGKVIYAREYCNLHGLWKNEL
ncbi:Desulfoferrodoxin [Fervidicella metallireducens AeB]|uniref:Desulfoferrodoxin n=1 Tax=Fervidicella metallireducens AeB TaxID=1403537 RepID=A0A017RUY7_9CLOT|nr:desulfoferrodoxin [Fervidicella metallireducens]EYE88543.1 Desulfoferrodoxin [Fervidicella metallireducens AeB]